jgi:hypothetical protein
MINKKSIYIHIGLHKTGTSAIQKNLDSNRKQLWEDGFYYPEPRKFNCHHSLAAKLHIKRHINNRKDNFIRIIKQYFSSSKGRHILLSSEIFSEYIDRKPISVVNKEIAPVKIILYIRRQDMLLESSYNQILKQTNTATDNLISNRTYSTDLWKVIREWEHIAGKGNIIVKFYERAKKTNLFYDFLDTLKIENRTPYEYSREITNESLSLLQTKILESILRRGLSISPDTREKLLSHIKNEYPDIDGPMVGNYLSFEQRMNLLNECRKGNEALSKAYFNENNIFADPVKGSDTNFVNIDNETVNRVINCLPESVTSRQTLAKPMIIA